MEYYDFYGNTLERAYDFYGNVIYENEPYSDDIQINDVASYFRSNLLNEVALINSRSDDVLQFVVLTDLHANSNALNSLNIARYLLLNSKADRLFLLGDYVGTWNSEEYEKVASVLRKCSRRTYATIGNHERYDSTQQDLQIIYNDFLKDKNWIIGNPSNFYFYLNDYQRKTRMIVINTNPENATPSISTEELDWLRRAVVLPDASWNVVVMGHVDIDSNISAFSEWNGSAKNGKIANAIKSTNGNIVGYFCGHEHCDLVTTLPQGFRQTVLYCDTIDNSKLFEPDGIQYGEQTRGTNTEQAVSIVAIDTKNRTVTIDRIGVSVNGFDYSYSY